jgi:hypothetical protein
VSQDIRRGILSVVVCRQKAIECEEEGACNILHSVSVKTAGPNPKVDVTFHACRDNDL